VAVNFGGGGSQFPLGQILGEDDILAGVALRPSNTVSYSGGATHVGIGILGDPDKHFLTPALALTTEHAGTQHDHLLLGSTDDLFIASCDGAGNLAGQFDDGEMMVIIFFMRRVGMYV
jgi:hypothetical protein